MKEHIEKIWIDNKPAELYTYSPDNTVQFLRISDELYWRAKVGDDWQLVEFESDKPQKDLQLITQKEFFSDVYLVGNIWIKTRKSKC